MTTNILNWRTPPAGWPECLPIAMRHAYWMHVDKHDPVPWCCPDDPERIVIRRKRVVAVLRHAAGDTVWPVWWQEYPTAAAATAAFPTVLAEWSAAAEAAWVAQPEEDEDELWE